jgi:hypothetical protein
MLTEHGEETPKGRKKKVRDTTTSRGTCILVPTQGLALAEFITKVICLDARTVLITGPIRMIAGRVVKHHGLIARG